MSPLPSSLSAPISSSTTRLSDLFATLKQMRRRQVRLDQAGDDVHGRLLRRQDQVNAGRPRFLGQADDVALDLLLHLHHQVRHLVDDDDDVRHLRRACCSRSSSSTGCTRRRISSGDSSL